MRRLRLSTLFLLSFSAALVARLLDAKALVLVPGALPEDVVRYVAGALNGLTSKSLISALSGVLIECPAVDEVFMDDEELKEIVDSLGRIR